jgi:hypothetical protein
MKSGVPTFTDYPCSDVDEEGTFAYIFDDVLEAAL